MVDYLTDKNGVFCHHCFATIDLTEIKWKPKPKWFKRIERLAGPRSFFTISYPFCKESSTYTYDKDVKPIANIEQMKKVYQEEVVKYVEKYLDAKGDTIKLLTDVARQELLGINTKNDTHNQAQKIDKKEQLEHFK
jgi:hypothetical protein